MLKLETPKESEKTLLLGDYVTVHMSSPKTTRIHSTEPYEILEYREELYQRIQRQRGEIIQQKQSQGGDLIDVRLREVA